MIYITFFVANFEKPKIKTSETTKVIICGWLAVTRKVHKCYELELQRETLKLKIRSGIIYLEELGAWEGFSSLVFFLDSCATLHCKYIHLKYCKSAVKPLQNVLYCTALLAEVTQNSFK